ncbi:MAG: hypothetical protein HYY25_04880 [Candidatus Wallbacteria bacterium]|nr:hypothetical protein [Candidatus Wallbacteria bacterium]
MLNALWPLPMALLAAAPLSAEPAGQLAAALETLIPRSIEAAGGARRWAGIRDLSVLERRSQLEQDGRARASEELEIFLQNVPHTQLLMVRRTKNVVVRQGWRRGEAWMVEDGLRVHDRFRLQSARRELLETLFLLRLPFCLPSEVNGQIGFEGTFLLARDEILGPLPGSRGPLEVDQLRFATGEYPGGDVRLYLDRATGELRGFGFHAPGGGYERWLLARTFEEHGVKLAWWRELTVDGKPIRRDELRKLVVNQWFSPDVFKAEAWLRR